MPTVFTSLAKAAATFRKYLRHGKEPQMDQIADYVQSEQAFMVPTTPLEDVTFDDLTDAQYTNATKH